MVEKVDQDTKQQKKVEVIRVGLGLIKMKLYMSNTRNNCIHLKFHSLHCTQHDLDITRRISTAARAVVSRPSCFGEVHKENSPYLPEEYLSVSDNSKILSSKRTKNIWITKSQSVRQSHTCLRTPVLPKNHPAQLNGNAVLQHSPL